MEVADLDGSKRELLQYGNIMRQKLCGNKDTIMTQGFADWRACNLG